MDYWKCRQLQHHFKMKFLKSISKYWMLLRLLLMCEKGIKRAHCAIQACCLKKATKSTYLWVEIQVYYLLLCQSLHIDSTNTQSKSNTGTNRSNEGGEGGNGRSAPEELECRQTFATVLLADVIILFPLKHVLEDFAFKIAQKTQKVN